MDAYRFHDLDRVIDEVHALFDAWAAGGTLEGALDAEGTDVLRLAVHEWVANLVQHARFVRTPEIVLHVEMEPDQVRCAIEDSSAGFDFAAQLETQKEILDAPAPSERGRGLLMLVTCTEDLLFQPASPEAYQRIAFSVHRSTASYLSSLFRPEDLEPEFDLADDLGLLDDPGSAPPPDARGDGALGAPATPPISTTDPS